MESNICHGWGIAPDPPCENTAKAPLKRRRPQRPVQEFLRDERRRARTRFQASLDGLDWSHGKSKHHQMRSAFGAAEFFGIDPDEAEDLIRARIEESGGHPNNRDIQRTRDYIYNQASAERDRPRPPAKGKKVNWDFIARIVGQFDQRAAESILESRSVVDPRGAGLETILGTLYEAGEKILIFKERRSQGDLLYEVGTPVPVDLPTCGRDGIFFLTNPVDGRYHPNPREGGKKSRRSEESITSFRYLLVESDEVLAETWLKILVMLPLPIAAVYTSGGKSIHALVQVDAGNKSDFDSLREGMLPILDALGADRGATSAVQLSRLPTAFRGKKEQRLLYLNPRPGSHPIIDLKPNCNLCTNEKS